MDMRVLVMGLGFFGKNWLKEVLACTECEVAGIVAKHPELLAMVAAAVTSAEKRQPVAVAPLVAEALAA